jgi:hypothetical protein
VVDSSIDKDCNGHYITETTTDIVFQIISYQFSVGYELRPKTELKSHLASCEISRISEIIHCPRDH